MKFEFFTTASITQIYERYQRNVRGYSSQKRKLMRIDKLKVKFRRTKPRGKAYGRLSKIAIERYIARRTQE